MPNLIKLVQSNNEYRVDSRLIAERLNIQHKNLMETLSKYIDKFQLLGSLPFKTETRKRQIGATQIKYALLNEDQAIFVLSLSRNTEQVVDLKLDLTITFKKLREQQPQQTALPPQYLRYLQHTQAIPRSHFGAIQLVYNEFTGKLSMVGHELLENLMLNRLLMKFAL